MRILEGISACTSRAFMECLPGELVQFLDRTSRLAFDSCLLPSRNEWNDETVRYQGTDGKMHQGEGWSDGPASEGSTWGIHYRHRSRDTGTSSLTGFWFKVKIRIFRPTIVVVPWLRLPAPLAKKLRKHLYWPLAKHLSEVHHIFLLPCSRHMSKESQERQFEKLDGIARFGRLARN